MGVELFGSVFSLLFMSGEKQKWADTQDVEDSSTQMDDSNTPPIEVPVDVLKVSARSDELSVTCEMDVANENEKKNVWRWIIERVTRRMPPRRTHRDSSTSTEPLQDD